MNEIVPAGGRGAALEASAPSPARGVPSAGREARVCRAVVASSGASISGLKRDVLEPASVSSATAL